MRGLASIYDYLHFALGSDVFACVCVPRIVIPVCMQYSKPRVYNIVSRLVEARCLVCCDCNTFCLPLAFSCRVC
jgi:hypothetical protein